MSVSRSLGIALIGAFVVFGQPTSEAQTYEGKQLVKAELLTRATAIVPGQPILVGLHLQMAPHWHTYWKFPGDAGIPTEIRWNLPPGWKAGGIQWPIPLKILEPGDIQIYGYHDEVLLLQELTPPASLADKAVKLSANADWLVCEKICIPGGADLQLSLPADASAAAANEELFNRFQRALPQPWPAQNASLNWSRTPERLTLKVQSSVLANYPTVDFFPLPSDKVVVGHQTTERTPDGVIFHIPIDAADAKLTSIPGTVVFGQTADGADRNAWEVGPKTVSAVNASAPKAQAAPASGLLKFLFFGFLGGFILNLMPCVLPVISLKIFGFINYAGKSRQHIFRSGLAFVAGIFVWFIGLALLLIVLQKAGSQVGWA
ncbi:MAG: protein-disulfide reductase DsbD domain-containing protein, partial [Chthoniobacterales bacterium]